MTSDQKVAVITGGGRGMGAAIARELHGRGYALALMSPSGTAEALAEELAATPTTPGARRAPGAIAVTGSTAEAGDLEALVAAALEAHGRIDAVVNHTGGPPKGDLLEISDDDWRRGLDLVVLSVVRMARLVTPVNITTFSAFEPSLTFPVSSVLRAGIGAYAKLYSDRYAKAGIRMNNILPGFIDSLAHKPETAEQVPMNRIGTVEEIAKTAAFLLSDDSGYITGQNLRVDGGLTRHM
jgi:NAD(P)-dependent dehydrogenase (short-subunit alcohol dehydrogenase family)